MFIDIQTGQYFFWGRSFTAELMPDILVEISSLQCLIFIYEALFLYNRDPIAFECVFTNR